MAKKVDFEHVRGDTYNQEFQFKNPDGSFVNLTGTTTRFTLRERPDGPIILQRTLTITDVVQGKIKLTLAAGITSSLLIRSYLYDYEFMDAGGIVTTLIFGEFSVKQDITY